MRGNLLEIADFFWISPGRVPRFFFFFVGEIVRKKFQNSEKLILGKIAFQYGNHLGGDEIPRPQRREERASPVGIGGLLPTLREPQPVLCCFEQRGAELGRVRHPAAPRWAGAICRILLETRSVAS